VSERFEVLIVCSGNTCRSPLAAALLTAHLERAGMADRVRVTSAGTSAWDGAPASEGSYLVALERGLDLSPHRARMLTPEMVRRADLVLTMSEGHARRVADLGGAHKVHTWGGYGDGPDAPSEITDPYGGDVGDYRATADLLDDLALPIVRRLTAELAP
jgi:protein-tyrosine-phosphatase